MKWYTVWDEEDEIVCYGTGRQCAEAMGIKFQSFRQLICDITKGKVKKYSVLIEEYLDVKEDLNE